MVTYADWIAFREAVLAADFLNRTEFLRVVVHSQIRQPGNLPDAPPSKALLASQALRLVPGERHCPECFASFIRLSFKYGVYRWCGPRYGDNRCALCDCKEYSATAIGFLHNVKQALWMAKLDALSCGSSNIVAAKFLKNCTRYAMTPLTIGLNPSKRLSVLGLTLSFMTVWMDLCFRV